MNEGKYGDTSHGFVGWREDKAKTWIEFTKVDGTILRWDQRGPSGACIGEGRVVT